MKYTEVTYKFIKTGGVHTNTVRETKGQEELYYRYIISTIQGILDAKDVSGRQLAVIVSVEEREG